ncbi:MAG: TonB-dependent receptor [Rhodothermales bacterium]|nr:TonB-dependent receptor [Rhodothermales bacterium]MBO6778897.1 TonB-dependent receptor [Rhodothermales bacterium]
MRWPVILAFLLVLAPLSVRAQFAAITGTITEQANGDALPGASVVVRDDAGTTRGTLTDVTGSFFLNRLRPGTYVLSVSFVGFATRQDTLQLGFDQTVVYDASLEATREVLDEVVVQERRGVEARSTAGLEVVRPSDLARVPMPDVAYDLAGYLLTLPGFVSTGDRGGQLFVRGGTSTQNLVLVDGIPVFQPFHIVGFYSAFPADIISFADVYAGGFGARYGGRISSVVDITTTNGNKEQAEGAASVAPFVSGLRFSVPVEPGKVSLTGSFRQSVIEQVAPEILGQELPFSFGDRYLKLHAFLNQTSSLSVTGLRTFDQGNLGSTEAERPSRWENDAFGFRYTFLPETQAVMSQFAMHYSRMKSSYQPAPEVEQRADVDAFTMEILIAYLLGPTRINLGLFGTLNRFDYDLGARSLPVSVGVTSGGVYADTQFELSPSFRIEPGIRYEVFSRGVHGSVAPRLRAMWLPFGPGSRQQVSFAWGRYHQQIVGLNNEQDVADVFTIWAPSPANEPVPQSSHYILGIQQRATRWLELSAEAYHKDLNHLAFPVFEDRPNGLAGFSRVSGFARGLDLRTQVTRRNFFASVGYTLANVEYTWSGVLRPVASGIDVVHPAAGGAFNPPHDRRHTVNASFQATRGQTRLSARWQLGSGLPFTQIEGFYRDFAPDPRNPEGLLTTTGTTLVARGEPYKARLPAYHRLDVSLEHDLVGPRTLTTFQAGVINVYDRANIFQYNFFSGERLNQLPLVPSLGLSVQFR